ncbi:glycosyltransferase family 4 protein [Pseudoalteromonas sp. MMG012]|uniref:glycosyltransferase family 4 protein n=1 Tax=Pseudoalteromonas sp. MMG012 TaxID=2822686 RepID=UPI001B3A2B05|nr:glycosyltransferase family 4 protein [Pseudoalteromonas sp. MMG012]MBQ4849228.1 glycosyltransferase family 4 protein [Pseudoalteromonas sp. MMG012]
MKNHIILVSNAYYPNIGGIENSLYHLAKSYQKDGYHVDILVGDINLVNDRSLPSFEALDGINVHRFGVRQWWCRFPILRSFARYIDMRKKLKTLIHCDTLGIVSRYHDTTVIAKIFCKLPVVYLVPGVVQEQDKPINTSIELGYFSYIKKVGRLYVHSMVQQLAFRMANQLVVFSENMKKQVEHSLKWSPPQITITKPGVDCRRFQPLEVIQKHNLKSELGLPLTGTLLLGVGRLVKAKGFNLLIEALLHSDSCYAIIIGDGPEKNALTELAKELHVEARVMFIGATSEPSIYYQAADIFMMTSTYEPLGQIVLEALASGLPIVAFSNKAAPQTATSELITNRECLFVDMICAAELGNAIGRLVSNPVLIDQLSVAGRNLALDMYDWRSLAMTLKVQLQSHQ